MFKYKKQKLNFVKHKKKPPAHLNLFYECVVQNRPFPPKNVLQYQSTKNPFLTK